jgi:Domain of Unknown Function (DUF928)
MTVQPIGSTRKSTRKLLTALLAACLLPIALPMLPAIAAPGYKPPSRKAAQRTEGTGRRNAPAASCAQDLAVPLTWLMPTATSASIPETTLAQPPLFLYLTKPKTLLITLLEHPAADSPVKSVTKVWEDRQSVEQTGMIQIAYPANQAPLEIGKTYSLRVEIDCGADQPEKKRYTRQTEAVLSRVTAPRSLQMRLQSAKSPRQRAEIYATAGLWTETLTAMAEAIESGQDPAAEKDLLALLEQVGLNTIVQREQANTPAVTPAVAPAAIVPPKTLLRAKPTVAPQPTEKKKDCDHQ